MFSLMNQSVLARLSVSIDNNKDSKKKSDLYDKEHFSHFRKDDIHVKKQEMPVTVLDELHTAGAGYDIIRYVGLPDVFGNQADALLYFMGKNMARKFEFQSLSDIVYAFEKLGWGHLELVKEKRMNSPFSLWPIQSFIA